MSKESSKNRFVFESFKLNEESKIAEFSYRIHKDGEDFSFTETLCFPQNKKWRDVPADVLNDALSPIHLALGMSYWKTFCSPDIVVESVALDPDQVNFWNKLYTHGMGEFFYKNKIDFRDLVNFPVSSTTLLSITPLPTSKERSLLLFGGGKDSLVSAELMKKAKKPFTWFFVTTGKQAELTKEILPKSAIIVHRELDPKLFELNKRPGVFNGHVPITAMISFIAEFAAILYGYENVITSNEQSSNYGNIDYLGVEINHQWSKSFEFEKMFKDYSEKHINPRIRYFSLLRPFHEIKIVEIFSRFPKYFHKFSSCNANFKILDRKVGGPSSAKATAGKWCGHCPKCAFVFLMLAVFLSKKKLADIFGKSLLDDPALIPLFKELLGLEKFKPFECVGTVEESRYALSKVIEGGEYVNDIVIRSITNHSIFKNLNIEKLKYDLFKTHEEHLIPNNFLSVIKNA